MCLWALHIIIWVIIGIEHFLLYPITPYYTESTMYVEAEPPRTNCQTKLHSNLHLQHPTNSTYYPKYKQNDRRRRKNPQSPRRRRTSPTPLQMDPNHPRRLRDRAHPGHSLKGKDMDVDLRKDSIRVGIRGETPIIEVPFHNHTHIHLELE